VVVASIEVPAGKESEAAGLLQSCAKGTRRELGNQAYTVCQSTDKATSFLVFEIYDDEAARQAHRASDHFQKFIAAGLRTFTTSFQVNTYELLSALPSD
jgi:quinol monooxygenase YgiN